MNRSALGLLGLILGFAILGSCATGPGQGRGDDAPAPSEALETQRRVARAYSPWPVAIDRDFRESAILTTADISFSHAPGWYFVDNSDAGETDIGVVVRIADTTAFFEIDTGRKLAALQEGDALYGRIVIASTDDPDADDPDARRDARFLQWLSVIPGEVVWSDESVRDDGSPLYLALLQRETEENLYAIAWFASEDREVILRLAGPAPSVRDNFPDLIRLAKTVTFTDSTPLSFRRIPGGLQFSDSTGRWRWNKDLAQGFILSLREAAPVGADTAEADDGDVAVWIEEEEFFFELLSEDVDEGEVAELLRTGISLRTTAGEAGEGGRR